MRLRYLTIRVGGFFKTTLSSTSPILCFARIRSAFTMNNYSERT